MFYGMQDYERTSNLGNRMSRNDYTLAEMTFPDFSKNIRNRLFCPKSGKKVTFQKSLVDFQLPVKLSYRTYPDVMSV